MSVRRVVLGIFKDYDSDKCSRCRLLIYYDLVGLGTVSLDYGLL